MYTTRVRDLSVSVSKGTTDVHDTLCALLLTTTIELDSSLRSNGSLDVILGESIGERFLCSIQVETRRIAMQKSKHIISLSSSQTTPEVLMRSIRGGMV